KENTPTVLSFFGNLINTIVNLGVAMAPFATKVLEMADSFFAWTSELFKNNEGLGTLIGVITMAVGIGKMFIPVVVGIATTFIKLFPFISKAFNWIVILG